MSATRPLPRWLDHFTDDQAHRFIELIDEIVQLRWPPDDAELRLQDGVVVMADGGVVGLRNIARQLAPIDDSRWRAELYTFLSSMDDIGRHGPLDLSDWRDVSKTLRPRLFPSSLLTATGARLTGTSLGPDLVLGLAARVSHGVAAINESHRRAWGVSVEDLWVTARANAAVTTGPDWDELGVTLCLPETPLASPVESEEGALPREALLMLSGGLFTTGLADDLTAFEQIGAIGELGALIAAPSSELLLVLPIHDTATLEFESRRLRELAARFVATEPHPIASALLHYREPGHLTPFGQ